METYDEIETERTERIVQGVEIILRAVTDLPLTERSLVRDVIDALLFHEGIL